MTLCILVPRKVKRPERRLLDAIREHNPQSALEFKGVVEPKSDRFWPLLVRATVDRVLLRESLVPTVLKAEMTNDPMLWRRVEQLSELDNPYRPTAPGFFIEQSSLRVMQFMVGLNTWNVQMLDGLAHRRYAILLFETA